jgi:REP element-mobilizing transposase RayT
MAGTFSQIYIQTIFAVRNRACLISSDFKIELYKYISGIVSNKDQKLIAINGVSDHMHILIGMKPNANLSDLVRDIKANSSRFVNEKRFVNGKFSWQEGFGAFSYSQSHLNKVIAYIQNQENHHRKKTFKEEYLELLEKFQIKYHKEYLFEWIE